MNKPVNAENTTEQSVEIPEISDCQESSQNKMRSIMQQMEMMALQRSNRNNFDISSFDKEQKDKLLTLMEKNEDNAFAYSTKKLEIQEKLNSKALDASIVDQKTLRFVLIGGGSALFIIMLLILFFKDEYFLNYLSFIAGLGGGFGLKGLLGSLSQKPHIRSTEEEEE